MGDDHIDTGIHYVIIIPRNYLYEYPYADQTVWRNQLMGNWRAVDGKLESKDLFPYLKPPSPYSVTLEISKFIDTENSPVSNSP